MWDLHIHGFLQLWESWNQSPVSARDAGQQAQKECIVNQGHRDTNGYLMVRLSSLYSTCLSKQLIDFKSIFRAEGLWSLLTVMLVFPDNRLQGKCAICIPLVPRSKVFPSFRSWVAPPYHISFFMLSQQFLFKARPPVPYQVFDKHHQKVKLLPCRSENTTPCPIWGPRCTCWLLWGSTYGRDSWDPGIT